MRRVIPFLILCTIPLVATAAAHAADKAPVSWQEFSERSTFVFGGVLHRAELLGPPPGADGGREAPRGVRCTYRVVDTFKGQAVPEVTFDVPPDEPVNTEVGTLAVVALRREGDNWVLSVDGRSCWKHQNRMKPDFGGFPVYDIPAGLIRDLPPQLGEDVELLIPDGDGGRRARKEAVFPMHTVARVLPQALRVGVPAGPMRVIEVLEDDAEGLLRLLPNDGGQGLVEKVNVYSGKAAVKMIPMQRYQRNIPGWGYRIAERPKAGECRYLRFAWRADGARGIMLQLHDEKDWNIRLTAGADEFNWGTRFVAPAPPERWTVVTRDLFAEFGERTIHGLALTVFGGTGGYFDHIYLGRSVDDLDRVDATGVGASGPPRLEPGDLDRLWAELAGPDAPKAYLAFWTLAAAPGRSVPFIAQALAPPDSPESTGRIKKWILQLDADEFAAREEASRQLAKHVEAAAGLMKEALPGASLESRIRMEAIFKAAASDSAGPARVERAVRILEYADTPEARKLLELLAKGEEGSTAAPAAKAALARASQ